MTSSFKPSTKAVEFAGRNWLTSQLLLRGFEVSIPVVDRGVDLIVFKEVGNAGIRALPLQLKCSSRVSFNIDQKYEGRGIPLCYIWHVLERPEAFFLNYEEAVDVLPQEARSSASWVERKYYAVTKDSPWVRNGLAKYANRWDWLTRRLDAQPTSG